MLARVAQFGGGAGRLGQDVGGGAAGGRGQLGLVVVLLLRVAGGGGGGGIGADAGERGSVFSVLYAVYWLSWKCGSLGAW